MSTRSRLQLPLPPPPGGGGGRLSTNTPARGAGTTTNTPRAAAASGGGSGSKSIKLPLPPVSPHTPRSNIKVQKRQPPVSSSSGTSTKEPPPPPLPLAPSLHQTEDAAIPAPPALQQQPPPQQEEDATRSSIPMVDPQQQPPPQPQSYLVMDVGYHPVVAAAADVATPPLLYPVSATTTTTTVAPPTPDPNTPAFAGQGPPAPPSLPDGWMEEIDPSTGNPYYINVEKNMTTWERPTTINGSGGSLIEQQHEELPPPDEAAAASAATSSSPIIGENENTDEVPTTQELPDGWLEEYDSNYGMTYYVKLSDGTTTWDRPTVPASASEAGEPPFIIEESTTEKDVEPTTTAATAPPLPEEEQQQVVVPNPESTEQQQETIPPASSLEHESRHIIGATTDVVEPDELLPGTVEDGEQEEEPPQLPDGWIQELDETSGMPYYINVADGTSTWERPVSVPTTEAAAEAAPQQQSVVTTEDHSGGTSSTSTGDEAAAAAVSKKAEQEEEEEETPLVVGGIDGPQQKEQVAAEPTTTVVESSEENKLLVEMVEDGAVDDDGAAESGLDVLPEGWSQQVDAASGRTYYVSVDGISTWDRPEAVPAAGKSYSAPPAEQEGIGGEAKEGEETTGVHDKLESSHEPKASEVVEEVVQDVPGITSEPTVDDETPLPEGWTEEWDENSSLPYYVHADGTSTWERPAMAGFGTKDDVTPAVVNAAEGPTVVVGADQTEVETDVEPPSDEKPEEQNETEPPTDDTPIGGQVSGQDELPQGWSMEIDEPTGTPYYVHVDGTTTWDNPLVVQERSAAALTAEGETEVEISPVEGVTSHDPHLQTTSSLQQNANLEVLQEEPIASQEQHDTDAQDGEKDAEEEPLPEGWSEHVDGGTGLPYYVHIDGTATWDRPAVGKRETPSTFIEQEAVVAAEPEKSVEAKQTPVEEMNESVHEKQPEISPPEEAVPELIEPETANEPQQAELPDEDTAQDQLTSEIFEASRLSKQPERLSSEDLHDSVPPPGELEEEVLPEGWSQLVDEGTGMPYYVHSDGSSTWTRPTIEPTTHQNTEKEALNTLKASQLSHDEQDATATALSSLANDEPEERSATKGAFEADELPDGWTKQRDESSGMSYYVYIDGTTTWEKPIAEEGAVEKQHLASDDGGMTNSDEKQPQETHEAGHIQTLPEGWTQELDENSGLPYYIHVDGTSTWERPVVGLETEVVATFAVENVVEKPAEEEKDQMEDRTGGEPSSEEQPEEQNKLTEPLDDSPEDQQEHVADELPEGWSMEIEESNGTPFYVHIDGTTAWEKPALVQGGSSAALGQEESPVRNTEVEASPDADESPLESELQTTNSLPIVLQEQQDTNYHGEMDAEDEPLPKGWSVQADEGTGMPYYVHVDGTATWDRPAVQEEASALALQEEAVATEPERFVETKQAVEEMKESVREDQPEISPPEEFGSGKSEIDILDDDGELPEGWSRQVDESTEALYYVHCDGSRTWDRPSAEEKEAHVGEPLPTDFCSEAEASAKPDDMAAERSEMPRHSGQTERSASQDLQDLGFASPVDDNDQLPEGWSQLIDEGSGMPYFVHVDGTSTWDRPVFENTERVELPAENPAETVNAETDKKDVSELPRELESVPNGWIQEFDESSGAPYYVNETDGRITWDRPSTPSTRGLETDDIPEEAPAETAGTTENELIEESSPEQTTESEQIKSSNARDDVDQSELPPGWEEVLDPSSGMLYYYHAADDMTTWEKPTSSPTADELRKSLEDESMQVRNASNATTSSSAPEETGHEFTSTEPFCEKVGDTEKVESEEIALPDGWIELLDPTSKRTYFYNETQNLTSWERPKVQRSSHGERRHGRPAHVIASFGFGGRLCLLRPSGRMAKVVQVKPTYTALSSDAFVETRTLKQQNGVIGPLASSDPESVISFLHQKSGVRNDLLWRLITIASKSQGRLRSSEGSSIPNSPESAIVDMLLETYPETQTNGDGQPGTGSMNGSRTPQKSLQSLEELLLRGNREEFVNEAVLNGDFAMALLVAAMCSIETYQLVAKKFADRELSQNEASRTIAFLSSGQLQGDSAELYWEESDPDALRRTWKNHLALILSNATVGWEKIVLALGDRLSILEETMAAHTCYMVCGCSVRRPFDRDTRLTLLGCVLEPIDLLLASNHSIEAFERTEAYEWAKRRGNRNAWISSLLPFKVAYALLLVEYGYRAAAGLYIESILDCMESTRESLMSAEMPTSPLWILILRSDRIGLLGILGNLQKRLDGINTEYTERQPPLSERLESKEKSTSEDEGDVDSSFVTAKTNIERSPEPSRSPGHADITEPQPSTSLEAIGEESTPAPTTDQHSSQPQDSKESAVRSSLGVSTRNEPDATVPLVTPTGVPASGAVAGAEVSTAPRIKKSRPETAPSSAPANLQSMKKGSPSSGNKKKAFFSFGIKDSVTKWLNPEAKIADVGEQMQAHYDKDKKVWVFPGEDPAEVAKPIGPPPTIPTAVTEAAPSQKEKSNDPLAAMMAPPQRRPGSGLRGGSGKPRVKPSPNSMPAMFPTGMAQPTPGSGAPKVSIFAPPAAVVKKGNESDDGK